MTDLLSARAAADAPVVPVLRVRDLVTTFHTDSGPVNAVRGVSFAVMPGETLAIVGESGSGKSVTAMSILDIVRKPGRIESGVIEFEGRDLRSLDEESLRVVRGGSIGMVFQDPVGSLNPLMKVRDQLSEAILAHEPVGKAEALRRSVELMREVGIPDPEARLADYPLAFSGGMSQRVMIAMALANRPKLVIADEPTTALDVTIQAQILELLARLSRDHGTAVILITHNLGIVARVCQRVAVMYAGRIVEEGSVDRIFAAPTHPYTRDLMDATPSLDRPRSLPLVAIEGRPPSMRKPIAGCAYAARDPRAFQRCLMEDPAFVTDAHGNGRACWLPVGELGVTPRPVDAAPVVAVAQVDRGVPPLLRVRDARREYPAGPRGWFGKRKAILRAVDGVDLDVHVGETVGLIGESGCGKSTLGRLILGIEEPTSGDVQYEDRSVVGLGARARRRYNRDVQLVFQNPMASLNPRMTVGQAIAEPLRLAGLGRGPVKARVLELLEMVGMDATAIDRFPHEFSGGQRQRVVIARALAVNPRLIVLDEAVAALDVSLQAQVINLLRALQVKLGLSYVFIGHDLATVRHVSDRVAVMYLGEIVEIGNSEAIASTPLHPYTASLISSVPEPDPVRERTHERIVLTGEVPTPIDPPAACRFHTRCPIGPLKNPERMICATEKPELVHVGNGRHVACHFAGELSDVGDRRSAPPAGLGPVRPTGSRPPLGG
jgi:peptide/nickel transport system ATP-binding protein